MGLGKSELKDPSATASRSRKATILLVEDDVLIRYATADLLRSEGHEVIEAANGLEALSLLRTGLTINLLISDIRMPGQPDGLELVGLARQILPELPVLLASSHFPQGQSAEAAFLAKPFKEDALLDTVQILVRNG